AQAGSSAISVARRPKVIDLGCGFHADLPSGTRSSTRRVAAISSSNSGISHSASGMHGLHLRECREGSGRVGRGQADPRARVVLTPCPPLRSAERGNDQRAGICLRNTDSALAFAVPPASELAWLAARARP